MSSAIPETIEVKGALCPFCGYNDGGCYGLDNGDGFLVWYCDTPKVNLENTRAIPAALQVAQTLTPSQQVEFIKALAKGLDVVVVPRDLVTHAEVCFGMAATAGPSAINWENAEKRLNKLLQATQEEKS